MFRHRTARKARRRTRATTSWGALLECLGARRGSQSPTHPRQTSRKRLAARRGGTWPTGVQYFRGKTVRGIPTSGGRARHSKIRIALPFPLARQGTRDGPVANLRVGTGGVALPFPLARHTPPHSSLLLPPSPKISRHCARLPDIASASFLQVCRCGFFALDVFALSI